MRPVAACMALCLAAMSLPVAAQTYQVLTPTAPQSDPLHERIERARVNLEALAAGRIQIGQLTPQELQDVRDLEARVRRSGEVDNRSTRQRCIDIEVERLGGKPSRLDWEVIDLKCR